jgi:hypothetical protein
MGSGSEIRNPEKKHIPDPGSGSATIRSFKDVKKEKKRLFTLMTIRTNS